MIKWTKEDVIKAFQEAMNPPTNGSRRMPSGLNTGALSRLLEQAKAGAPTPGKPVPTFTQRPARGVKT